MTRPVSEWQQTATPAPHAPQWDGHDDTWLTADETMKSFLDSFTKKDIRALRSEGRVRHFQVRPKEHATDALRAALDSPTMTRWSSLRDYTDRELAQAARVLDAERLAAECEERPARTFEVVEWDDEEPDYTDQQTITTRSTAAAERLLGLDTNEKRIA